MQTDSSHNLFLDLLVWNGVPVGVLLALGVAAWCISRGMREQTVDSWFPLALIGSVMVHAMVEFPLSYAYFLLPVFFCAGIVDHHITGCFKGSIVKPVFALVLTIAGALFFGVVGDYFVAEERLRQYRFRAMGIIDGKDAVSRDDSSLRFLTQFQAFFEFADSQARIGMTLPRK